MKVQIPAASRHYAKELMEEVNADPETHGKKPFDDEDEPPVPGKKRRDNISVSGRRAASSGSIVPVPTAPSAPIPTSSFSAWSRLFPLCWPRLPLPWLPCGLLFHAFIVAQIPLPHKTGE